MFHMKLDPPPRDLERPRVYHFFRVANGLPKNEKQDHLEEVIESNDECDPISNVINPRRRNPVRLASKAVKACTECGRTRTPMWRKGPGGPKTLCNACYVGRRKNKKRVGEMRAESGTGAEKIVVDAAEALMLMSWSRRVKH
ncbi:hypothetical protein IFM89_014270 [Coptis chinensis]|uniref:GATA-type domain-containing protein n=1 Tax=Coptis chinensis TaxID=261450 RepID=A0A835LHX1_9MAGN|nr:hypothetical protein IFM89_014270 [Coptis chinensis]